MTFWWVNTFPKGELIKVDCYSFFVCTGTRKDFFLPVHVVILVKDLRTVSCKVNKSIFWLDDQADNQRKI